MLRLGEHHSGFNVYCGKAIWPHNQEGLESLARYIIQASFSQERMTYIAAKNSSDRVAKVIYQSKSPNSLKLFLVCAIRNNPLQGGASINSTASSQTQNSEFEKVGQWLFFTRSALGWVAAFFCALTVAYLSLVFALPYLAANMFGMLSIFFPSSASMSIIPILLAFIFCPLLFIPGLAVGRFLLKSFPPRLSGKRRRWLLGYLIIMTIFWVISMGIGIFGFASEVPTVNNPAVSGFQGTKVPTINFPESSNFYRAARLFDSALYKGLQFMSALFWWFGFAIPLFQRHWTPHKPLEKPFQDFCLVYRLSVCFPLRFFSFPSFLR